MSDVRLDDVHCPLCRRFVPVEGEAGSVVGRIATHPIVLISYSAGFGFDSWAAERCPMSGIFATGRRIAAERAL